MEEQNSLQNPVQHREKRQSQSQSQSHSHLGTTQSMVCPHGAHPDTQPMQVDKVAAVLKHPKLTHQRRTSICDSCTESIQHNVQCTGVNHTHNVHSENTYKTDHLCHLFTFFSSRAPTCDTFTHMWHIHPHVTHSPTHDTFTLISFFFSRIHGPKYRDLPHLNRLEDKPVGLYTAMILQTMKVIWALLIYHIPHY